MQKPKMVVLTGAGISAESGLKTFRDADGLWEGHDVLEVATPQGWQKNPELVLDFYNQRRRQLLQVEPNLAHKGLVDLEANYEIYIVTQNVDDLHERAGSTNVLHLHGELLKVRSTLYPTFIYDWSKDLILGDVCQKDAQLRPHIVWFGEDVPLLQEAAELCSQADILVIIGSSLQVYPAAGLMSFANQGIPVYYIDKNPAVNHELRQMSNLKIWNLPATQGVEQLILELTS
ncbi:MAG: NAD-dependent deacylase [Saprospiraceae bacterium]|nr:NAD-dependent deacylase [Saprospiraceae bacterium]MBK7809940.1 NAD-dependent deacylase [Saprospiraceae bacterium]MBK9629545.1 NAD-dependent deacylase [Saprospiraceae bacterium]